MNTELVPIDDLTPDPANARKHGERNLSAIIDSLRAFGQQKPIVVDRRGVVIAGNGTLEAAKRLGWEEIAVVRTELDPTQATAFGIADNRTAELAEWDEDVLVSLLDSLDDETRDLLHFDEKELEAMVPKATVEVVEDDVPEEVEPRTKPGDLWLLGDHRLLCGDSTKAEDVARLMDGEKADLCFTSPPYALGSSVALSGNRTMSERGNAYEGHEDTPEGWPDLMAGWWNAFDGVATCSVVNVQPLAGNKRDLMRWIADRSDRLVDIAIWNKITGAPQMASGVLTSIFEFLVIFGDENASRRIPFASWHGTVGNVYDGPPQRSNEFADQHAATMPTHLVEWIIGTLCDQAKTVVDPFAGTGTTAIVAEQMGRRSFGMEIDPAYCDIIVRRWENLTGETAVLADA
jgi:DNA modification methylase